MKIQEIIENRKELLSTFLENPEKYYYLSLKLHPYVVHCASLYEFENSVELVLCFEDNWGSSSWRTIIKDGVWSNPCRVELINDEYKEVEDHEKVKDILREQGDKISIFGDFFDGYFVKIEEFGGDIQVSWKIIKFQKQNTAIYLKVVDYKNPNRKGWDYIGAYFVRPKKIEIDGWETQEGLNFI